MTLVSGELDSFNNFSTVLSLPLWSQTGGVDTLNSLCLPLLFLSFSLPLLLLLPKKMYARFSKRRLGSSGVKKMTKK